MTDPMKYTLAADISIDVDDLVSCECKRVGDSSWAVIAKYKLPTGILMDGTYYFNTEIDAQKKRYAILEWHHAELRKQLDSHSRVVHGEDYESDDQSSSAAPVGAT